MYQLNVFVHILSAIVWIGGMLFLALVVVPSARTMQPKERAALFDVLGRRFRTVGWVCIVLLVVTGTINLAYRNVTWESVLTGELFASDWGRLVALKIGVVVVMIGLSVIHDFFIGPASTRVWQRADPAALQEAARLRRRASWLGRLNALFALLAVALGVMLVRGWPF